MSVKGGKVHPGDNDVPASPEQAPARTVSLTDDGEIVGSARGFGRSETLHTLDLTKSVRMNVTTKKANVNSMVQSRRWGRRGSQDNQNLKILKSRKPRHQKALKGDYDHLNARERALLRVESQQDLLDEEAVIKKIVLDKLTQMDGPMYPIYPTEVRDELAKMVYDSVTNKEDAIENLNNLGGVQGIAKLLCIDPKKGLLPGTAHAKKLANSFGKNELPGSRDADFLGLIMEALNDTMMIILCLAAVVSLVLGLTPATSEDVDKGWIKGTAILVAVALVTLITAVNDYKKALQFKKLNEMNTSVLVTVMRNGLEMEVNAFDVMMGDILIVDVGNKIPADGVYLEGENITCDESGCTGEQEPQRKGNPALNKKASPFFISGTSVLSGYGKFLVVAVGENSFDGKVRMAIRAGAEDDEGDGPKQTPLQDKLDALATFIGKVGTWLALAAGIALTIILVIRAIEEDKQGRVQRLLVEGENGYDPDYVFERQVDKLPTKLVNVFILCVTIVVVAVPEGLPMSVMIALAYALTRMVKENNLVREMDACETMGGVTTICSDKTGTLTENKMTVSMGDVAGTSFNFIKNEDGSAVASDLKTMAKQFAARINPDVMRLINTLSAVNTTCYEGVNKEAKEGDPPTVTQGGNPTEHALVRFCMDSQDMDYVARRNDFLMSTTSGDNDESKVTLLRIAFSSARKMMSSVVSHAKPEIEGKTSVVDYNKPQIYTKGAAEIIMDRCVLKMNADGTTSPFTEADKSKILETIKVLSENSLRPIGLANREVTVEEVKQLQAKMHAGDDASEDEKSDDAKKKGEAAEIYEIETKLTWLGIVGIRDPLRPEVPGAVQACQEAGIRVIMVTGDNLGTAKAIAKDCNIYHEGVGIAMEGKVFRKLSPEQMKAVIPRLCVLARSSPQDKQTLVKAVQADGEIVAVTGDGTNDGPALSMADVGFSMGAGTEVAKEASKIILLDNNFASVVTAVLWGRSVYDSIRCFLQFQLTVNCVAMVITLIGAFSDADGEPPLSPVMLLWVNLIMDTFAALALSTQPPTPDLMTYAPAVRDDPLINNRMKLFIGIQGTYQLVVNLVVLYLGADLFDIEVSSPQHRTLVFNTFVLCQVFNECNARKVHRGQFNVFAGATQNVFFLGVMAFSILIQVLMVEVFGDFAGAAPLTSEMWLFCLLLAALSLPLGLIVNLVGLSIPERLAVNALERLKGPMDTHFVDIDSPAKEDEKVEPNKPSVEMTPVRDFSAPNTPKAPPTLLIPPSNGDANGEPSPSVASTSAVELKDNTPLISGQVAASDASPESPSKDPHPVS